MAIDDADKQEIQAAVQTTLDAWQPPEGKYLGWVWIIAVGLLAVVTLIFVLAWVAFSAWRPTQTDTTNQLVTFLVLLLGGFLGFVGGSKAASK